MSNFEEQNLVIDKVLFLAVSHWDIEIAGSKSYVDK